MMGLFDKIKKAFESDKENDNSENSTKNNINYKEENEAVLMTHEQINNTSPSLNILFVCPTNRITSPIAAAIFNQKVIDKKAFSAGISAREGYASPPEAIEVCAKHGIDLSAHRTINIDAISIDEMDLILTSASSVRDELKKKYPHLNIFTMKEYYGDYDNLDITNHPFSLDPNIFDKIYDEIYEVISKIINKGIEISNKPTPTNHEINKEISTTTDKEITISNKPTPIEEEINEDSKSVPKVKNFRNLQYLIKSGEKEIFLDSDIVVENHCTISNDLTIDGNGHFLIGPSRIFHINAKVTLKNITFKNSNKVDTHMILNADGGCIVNKGELNIINCIFLNNHSSHQGGAIFNDEKALLKIKKCYFIGNTASSAGGAIENKGQLTVSDTIFESNEASSGGAISNTTPKIMSGGGIIKKFYTEHYFTTYAIIDNCTFKNNVSDDKGNSIFNDFYMRITNTDFIDECLKKSTIIYQGNMESKMNLMGCDISSKCAKIYNNGFFNLEFSNLSSEEELVINEGEFELKEVKLSNNNVKIIYNNSILKIQKDDPIIENVIQGENSKIKFFYEKLPRDWKGFAFLDDIIHKGSKKVSIECDITLNSAEIDFYEGGIELDIDDMVIDGNHHTIDAQNFSRIFYITGKNITIKNLKFLGGKFFTTFLTEVDDGGGAILITHNASVKFVDCQFIENESQISGGVLCNKGLVEIQKCIFDNNKAKKYGGVINNQENKHLKISQSKFINNKTEGEGGVMSNRGSIDCDNSYFYNNYCDGENNGGGGGVLKNIQMTAGNTVSNFYHCEFKKNSTRNEGGVINIWGGKVILEKCIFSDNSAFNGDVLFSREFFVFNDFYDFIDCEFNNNSSTFDTDIDD